MSEIETKPSYESNEEMTAIVVDTQIVSNPTMEETIANTKLEDIPCVDEDVKECLTENIAKSTQAAENLINPKENAIAWLNSLVPNAVHKVNYQLLDWIQSLVTDSDERQPLPGKNDSMTKNQFLNFLKDGTLLAKLANRLQPGAVDAIYEGEEGKVKENQAYNINSFIKFVKEKSGLPDDQIFSVEDLQDKGKAGYQAVFNTIMQMGIKAQSTFEQKGIDVDRLVQDASQVTQTNIVQSVLNFFRKARPPQALYSPTKAMSKGIKKEKESETGINEKVEEEKNVAVEICKKVDTQTVEPTAIKAN